MDTPNSSPSTFNTDLQLSSVFTLDDLIDSNLLPVLGNDVPELSFTPTSPDSSSSRVNTFLRWPSEENNTLTFLKAAPGLLFGNLSQIDTDVEPTADTQGASAMLKPLNQNLHDQWYEAENVMNSLSQPLCERYPDLIFYVSKRRLPTRMDLASRFQDGVLPMVCSTS